MTSHNIIIAKAAFAAACSRPDAAPVSREEITNFHSLLETAISKCSASNVQTCKQWLLDNVVQSTQRVTALGKYLVTFSKCPKPEKVQTKESSISQARKQLHILYILNDLLHHVKYHAEGPTLITSLQDALQLSLLNIFQLARLEGRQRVGQRLDDLLTLWSKEQFLNELQLLQARKASPADRTEVPSDAIVEVPDTKETPYVMPATHGDPATPYYDLPAGNLMPHIIPNKSIPIRTDQIRALSLSARPVEESLIHAVKDFLHDIGRIEDPFRNPGHNGTVVDMDEIGQLSYRDDMGEAMWDTYYGWSKDFCSRMKRRNNKEGSERGRRKSLSFSRSRSSSRNRSLSRSPPKRRRYSGSNSRSPQNRERHRNLLNSQSPDRQYLSSRQSQTSSVIPGPTIAFVQSFNGETMHMPSLPNTSIATIPPPYFPNHSGVWPPPPPPPPPEGFSTVPFQPPRQLQPDSDRTQHFKG